MEEEVKKGRHGGARKGAGRKPDNHGKYYGFNSTKEVEAIIEALDTSKTKFINLAIMHYAAELGLV